MIKGGGVLLRDARPLTVGSGSTDFTATTCRNQICHGSAKQSSATAQGPLTSDVPSLATVTAGEGTNPHPFLRTSMTLFMISVPLMALAVALAVLPLIFMSHADHRRRMVEATPRRGGHFLAPATETRDS